MSRVQVIWWRTETLDLAELEACRSWLSPGEVRRWSHFLRPRDRDTFFASRILLRHTLAAVTGHPPEELRFSTDAHGVKPWLVAPPDRTQWHFSLTHTDGLVACAVTTRGEVGLDAEALRRAARIDALVPRVLSPAERAEFMRLEGAARRRRFFEAWCVKEAWLKAEGTGLRVAPTTVEVTFAADGVRAGSGVRAVRLLDVAPEFVVALAHPPDVPRGDVEVRPFDWPAVRAAMRAR